MTTTLYLLFVQFLLLFKNRIAAIANSERAIEYLIRREQIFPTKNLKNDLKAIYITVQSWLALSQTNKK